MKAILDFVPGCCPNCGTAIRIVGEMVREYFEGEGWTCRNCDCHIEYTGAFDGLQDASVWRHALICPGK